METRELNNLEAFNQFYFDLTGSIYGTGKKLEDISNEGVNRYIVQMDGNGRVCSCCIYFAETKMEHYGRPVVCFGYFESENNQQAVRKMLNHLNTLRQENEMLFGPINGSTWDSYRLATDNFEQCFPMDIAHPEYYPLLLENAGWIKARSYSTHVVNGFEQDEALLKKDQAALTKMNLKVRTIDLQNFEAELNQVYELCIKSFVNSFLFSPIGCNAFKKKYLRLQAFLKEEYVLLAVDESGKLKAFLFAICFPDGIGGKAILIKTVARDSKRVYAGLGGILTRLLNKQAKEDQCSFGVHAFMEEENVSQKVSEKHSGKAFKSYALYRSPKLNKSISD